MKTTVSVGTPADYGAFVRFFDIVNGFLIDAVAHRVKKMSGFRVDQDRRVCGTYNLLNLVKAEFGGC